MVETLNRISRVKPHNGQRMVVSHTRGAGAAHGVPAKKVRLILESSRKRCRWETRSARTASSAIF